VALTHLVDTSVLTRVGSPPVRSALEPLVEAGSAARAGISDLEVGSNYWNSSRRRRHMSLGLAKLRGFCLRNDSGAERYLTC
jgi:hypothetical protein